MNALVPIQQSNADVYRASTDAAGLCRDIVLKTAMSIQGRKYVKVEGWQAIAIAHGCVASADDVHRVSDEGMTGFSAMGVIRRMSDGAEIARAEGFLGDDETMWAKRPVYARRAMAQTRAISRACRSAFAHVVVLIDANLSTTPAEEVPDGGFDDHPAPRQQAQRQPRQEPQERAAPAADKPVDRTGDTVPAPKDKDAEDWKAWRLVITKKISRATTKEQVAAIQKANGADLIKCADVLPDTLSALGEFVDKKLAQLGAAEGQGGEVQDAEYEPA